MLDVEFSYPQRIEKNIRIHASLSVVWSYLTIPEFILLWMGDPEMDI